MRNLGLSFEIIGNWEVTKGEMDPQQPLKGIPSTTRHFSLLPSVQNLMSFPRET